MGILGNVENGWFAQLAHACRSASHATLNVVSCGNQWGDKLYTNMDATANNYVSNLNQQAIDKARAGGATQHQALSAGSAAMEKIANPTSATELAELAGHGASIAGQTVEKTVTDNQKSSLNPLLIGGAILAGIYALLSFIPFFNSKSDDSAEERREARQQRAEAIARYRNQEHYATARKYMSSGINPSVLPANESGYSYKTA